MEESNALTIASIHATILAITIAGLGIMVSIVGDKKLSILQEIIEKQRSIGLLFPTDWRVNLLYDRNDPKLKAEKDNVPPDHLISSVIQAALGGMNCNPQTSCPTPADDGKTAFTTLAFLVTHYPFSKTAFNPDGTLDITPMIKDGAYRKWLLDIEYRLSALRALESYRGGLMQKVGAYQDVQRGHAVGIIDPYEKNMEMMSKQIADLDKEIGALPELDSRRVELQIKKDQQILALKDYDSATPPNYKKILAKILDGLNQARKDVEGIMPKAHILKYYDEMSSSGLGIVIFISIILTFLFGIFSPMTHKFFGHCNATWCPYILYVIVPICGHVITASCAWWMISESLK